MQGTNTIQGLFSFALSFINDTLVPLIFAVAFIVFLFKIYQYFIAGGADEEKVRDGRKFLGWSLLGFVVMFSIWGLVNVLLGTLPFDSTARPPIQTFGGGGTQTPAGGSTYSPGGVTNSSNCGSFDTRTQTYGTTCSAGYICVNNQCVSDQTTNPNKTSTQCGAFNDYTCTDPKAPNCINGQCVP